jgi:hypothetical protein
MNGESVVDYQIFLSGLLVWLACVPQTIVAYKVANRQQGKC